MAIFLKEFIKKNSYFGVIKLNLKNISKIYVIINNYIFLINNFV